MPEPPRCKNMGRHCRELTTLLKLANKRDETPASIDQIGTWLLGHTERIAFGKLFERRGDLLVNAKLRVPCRYLRANGTRAACTAHGFHTTNLPEIKHKRVDRKQGGEGGATFEIMTKRRMKSVTLSTPRRSLPVITKKENPCLTAPCQTSDHKMGAACCRDLVIEMVIPKRAAHKEALLRSRQSPYLCKVERTDADTIEAEMISACSYIMEEDGVSCALHGRRRPNGRVAKPYICTRWPDDAEVTHRGCALARRDQRPD